MSWLKPSDIKKGTIRAEHIDSTTTFDFLTTGVKADVIAESTSAAGVTADGVLLKDSGVTAAGASAFTSTVTTTDGVASGVARKIGGAAYILAANGTALTNSTDEAVLAAYSIPASTFKIGTIVKVKFLARVSAEAGATTFTPRLRLGATTLTGTELFVGSAVDAVVDHIVTGEFMLIGRAVPGAAAAIVGVGSFSQSAAAGGAMISAALPSTNFATNGALRIELTGDLSAADATSVRAEIFTVEIIG